MNPSKLSVRRASFLLASMLVGSSLFGAADDTTTAVPSNSTASVASAAQSQDGEIARLKAALAEQQKQLQALQQMLQNQQQMIERATAATTTPAAAAPDATAPAKSPSRLNLGDIASLVPVLPAPVTPSPVPVSVAVAAPRPNPQAGSTQNAAGGNPCEAPPDASQVPPYLRIGSVCVVPVGFMDLTPFWRDKAAATGTMGSNFGSVPYNNTVQGNLSEYHFSIQNSRLGFRVDGDWKGAHFIGYNEFDFNGTGGATNYGVTNGAVVPRLRLYWVDVRKGNVEFLGGQSWSMLVPNRRGLSALPGDLFYSQVIDINYIAGLTWTRQPGLRVLLHGWHDKVNFGFSVEQGDQYAGGSGGGGAITLPTNIAASIIGSGSSAEIDEGQNVTVAGYLNQPTFTPDFIAKVAFDPSSRLHFEVAGIESNWHTAYNLSAAGVVSIPATGSFNLHQSANGGGVTFGLNAGITNNIRLIASGMYSDGEGRYLFGAGPDFIVRANGALSPIHADSWISGVEATVKNTLLYAYYSGDYIGRNVAIDTNGSLIGYGYKGSSNSQNRSIQEVTFGFNQTMWRNPRYGAINVMGQYEWLERMPWYVAAGSPKNTHDNTIYFDLRYTLPGSMPNF
ncbi:MAG TPA: hypothetical protein VK789_22425 [Bryobacteraceae bacterium]|nr:hypothetical protein [Bryobacteraceae bacterium]